jgi:hypothetical protein
LTVLAEAAEPVPAATSAAAAATAASSRDDVRAMLLMTFASFGY